MNAHETGHTDQPDRAGSRGARLLTNAMDVVGRPVVTLGGEDIAQIRDVLFTRDGVVPGFTLAGRGLLAGPMEKWLPWSAVHGFGPDAVIVADDGALSDAPIGEADGDVVGDDVLTRSGRSVGTVVDAVLRLESDGLDLVGYEIDVDADSTRFLPLPDTLSVTGGRLVVPDEAVEFLSTDLAGFGSAVDTFRQRLRGDQP